MTRTRGPFDIDTIALDSLGGIPLAFEGPGKHGLATPLADGSQFDEGRCAGDADFFGELTAGGVQSAFTGFNLALGDCPNSVVPVREPRTARVRNKHFQSAAVEAVHQEAGADAGVTHDWVKTLNRPTPEAPPTGGRQQSTTAGRVCEPPAYGNTPVDGR